MEATNCQNCPAGRYVDTGGSDKCFNCPEGKFAAAQGSTSCQNCPAGKFQNTAGSSSCTDCPAGKFLTNTGSTTGNDCARCPAGRAQPSPGSSGCPKCPTGTYQPDEVSTSCIQCPSGRYAPTDGNERLGDCIKCGLGRFSSSQGQTSASVCQACGVGRYADEEGSSSCPRCPAGTHSAGTGETSPNTCRTCVAGRYSAAGADFCTQCGAGKWSSTEGATAESMCQSCAAGRFSTATGAGSSATCAACPAGQASSALAATSCAQCIAGTYSLAGSQTCTSCPAGRFSGTAGATLESSCQACVPGQYAGSGATACTKCSAGRYGTSSGATSASVCLQCPSGTFAAEGSSQASQCVACPAGRFIDTTAGSSVDSCKVCQAGKYAGSSATTCNSCPVGKFLDTSGAMAESACKTCEAGRYASLEGSATCMACLPGTYNTLTGSRSQADCLSCAAGTYSTTEAAVDASTCLQCDAGRFSTQVGAFQASACQACALGRFSNVRGASAASTCADCAAGRYSDTLASTSCVACGAGRFSPTVAANSSTTCQACSPGFFSTVVGAQSNDTCQACIAGRYAVSPASQSCTSCLAGTYSAVVAATVASTCLQCARGRWSDTVGANSSALCRPCDLGSYADQPGSTVCTKCVAGTYSDTPEATTVAACIPCERGRYSAVVGASNVSTCLACPAGQFANQEGSKTCSPCVAGRYSTSVAAVDSSVCLACPLGTASSTVAASTPSTCVDCAAGRYADSTAMTNCTACVAGKFSDVVKADSVSTCRDCAAGRWSATVGAGSDAACLPCDAGKVSAALGASVESTCVACVAGRYAPSAGLTTCTACVAGKYSAVVGSPAESNCLACVAGRYSTTVAANASSTCLPCVPGRYSTTVAASASSTCLACVPGRYSTVEAATAESMCQRCDAGRYSTTVAASASSTCLACVPGRYSAVVGASDVSTCLACVAGTFSAVAAANSSLTCRACVAGTFSPVVAASSVSTCTPCWPGTFSPFEAANASTTCRPCPLRTASAVVGATSLDTCAPCGMDSFTYFWGSTSCLPCILLGGDGRVDVRRTSSSAALDALTAFFLDGAECTEVRLENVTHASCEVHTFGRNLTVSTTAVPASVGGGEGGAFEGILCIREPQLGSTTPLRVRATDWVHVNGTNFVGNFSITLHEPTSGLRLPCHNGTRPSTRSLRCLPPLSATTPLDTPLIVEVDFASRLTRAAPVPVELVQPVVAEVLLSRRLDEPEDSLALLRGTDLFPPDEAWTLRGLAPPATYTIRFGNESCEDALRESDSLVSCRLPRRGEGHDLAASVQVRDVHSAHVDSIVVEFAPPEITAVLPAILLLPGNASHAAHAPTAPLSEVVSLQLIGRRLGVGLETQLRSVLVLGVACRQLVRDDDTSVRCEGLDLGALRSAVEAQLPPGNGSLLVPVVYTWGSEGARGQASTPDALRLVARPVITHAMPEYVRPLGTLAITGSSLGWEPSHVATVLIGNVSCPAWTLESPELILCTVMETSRMYDEPTFPRFNVSVVHALGARSREHHEVELPREPVVSFHPTQAVRVVGFPSGFRAADIVPVDPPLRLLVSRLIPLRCWLEIVVSDGDITLVGDVTVMPRATSVELPLTVAFPNMGFVGEWGSSAKLRGTCASAAGEVTRTNTTVMVVFGRPQLAWESVEAWTDLVTPEDRTPELRATLTIAVDWDLSTLVPPHFFCTALVRVGVEATTSGTALTSLSPFAVQDRETLLAEPWHAGPTNVTFPRLSFNDAPLGSALIFEAECEWVPNQSRMRLPALRSSVADPSLRWTEAVTTVLDGGTAFVLSGLDRTWVAHLDGMLGTPASTRALCKLEEVASDGARLGAVPPITPEPSSWDVRLSGSISGAPGSSAQLRSFCTVWGQTVQSPLLRLEIDELETELVAPFPPFFLPSSANDQFHLEPVPRARVLSRRAGQALSANVTCALRSLSAPTDVTYDGPLAFEPAGQGDPTIVFARVALRSRFDVLYLVELELSCATTARQRAAPLVVTLRVFPLSVRWCELPSTRMRSQAIMKPWSIAVVGANDSTALDVPCEDLRAPTEFASAAAESLSCSVSVPNKTQESRSIVQGAIESPNATSWVAVFDMFSVAGLHSNSYDLAASCSLGSVRIDATLPFSVALLPCNAGEEPDGYFCRQCESDSFALGGVESKCMACPERGVRCKNGVIELRPGFYRVESQREDLVNSDMELHRCWNDEACVVDNANLSYACSFGHSGPLCGVCDRSVNFERFGKSCQECWPAGASALVLLVLLGAFLATTVMLALKFSGGRRSEASIALRILLSYVQGLGALGVFKARGTATFRNIVGFADSVSGNPFSLGPIQCLLNMSFVDRFVLIVLTPIVATLTVIASFVVITFVRSWMGWGDESDGASSPSSSSASVPTAPSLARKGRAVTAAATAGAVALVERRSPGSTIGAFFRERRFFASFSFIMFLAYMPLVNQSFQALDCYDEPIDKVVYYEQDLTVECPHKGAAALAVFILSTVGVGLPLGLLLSLRRKPEAELADPRYLNQFGFLYDGYDLRRGMAWWESVVLTRKAGIVLMTLVVDPFVQLAAALMVIGSALWLNERWRPYRREYLNNLESLSLAVLFVSVALSLIYFRDSSLSDDGSSAAMDLALTVVLLLLNFAMAARLVWEVLRKRSKDLLRETSVGRRLGALVNADLISEDKTAGPSIRGGRNNALLAAKMGFKDAVRRASRRLSRVSIFRRAAPDGDAARVEDAAPSAQSSPSPSRRTSTRPSIFLGGGAINPIRQRAARTMLLPVAAAGAGTTEA